MITLGDNLPDRPSTEAFHAEEINETYGAFNDFIGALKVNPELLPPDVVSSNYTFIDFTPPFPFPHSVGKMDDPIVKVMLTLDRTDELESASLAIWHESDGDEPNSRYDRTDLFGDDLFVRVAKNGAILERSMSGSHEVEEFIVNLALSREQRLKLALGKASRVVSSFRTIGALSPLIEAGLESNATETVNTSNYSFYISDKNDRRHEITFSHTEGIMHNIFYAHVRSTSQDGGVTRTANSEVTLSKHVNLDSADSTYRAEVEGTVEIYDEDFPNDSIYEEMEPTAVLDLIGSLLRSAADQCYKNDTSPDVKEIPISRLD